MRLENGIVSFDFDDATGSLMQITNLRTGKGFLSDPRGFRLVKLIVPTPEHVSRVLHSHEAGPPEMTRNGDTLRIVFPQLRYRGEGTGVFAEATVRLPAGSQEAFFTLKIRNEGPNRVIEAWFPVIGGRSARRGKQPDDITLSYGKGYQGAATRDLYNRFGGGAMSSHAFSRHCHRVKFGPLPMMDLDAPEGGLSYIQYEKRPTLTKLVFENLAPGLDDLCVSWAWARYPCVEPGESWTSCEYGVGVHEGDWHVTADRLRAFTETWWRPSGMAPSIRERIGMFHVQTHGFSGEVFNEFEDLPAIARDCLRYGVRDFSIWDCTASLYYRPDTGGFWEMPAERLASFKAALAEVRKMGCRTNACVNWRLITSRNRMWNELSGEVQQSIFGQGMYGFPCGSMDGAQYGDESYEQGSHSLCQASERFQRFAMELVEKTLDLGFTDLFIDQCVEQTCCYAKNHGHRTPQEAIEKAFVWIREALRRVRARDPEAYVVAEVPELWNTQWADLWWCWGYRDGAWARAEVLRYVLGGMVPLWPIDENQRECVAEAFATGSLMAIATRDMTGTLSDAPELAAQVARLGELRKATAPFVSHGLFHDTIGIDVENGSGFVYTSPAGLAVTLANSKDKQANVKVTVRPEQLGKAAGPHWTLRVEGAEPVRLSPVRTDDRVSFDVTLPPYAAAVVTGE